MKRMMMLLAMLLVAGQAQAHEIVLAKVSLVESTYMPGQIAFQLSGGTASCQAGRWLFWQRDAENNKAVYAMLMSALVSGKQVRIFFNDGDTNCVPMHMHMVD